MPSGMSLTQDTNQRCTYTYTSQPTFCFLTLSSKTQAATAQAGALALALQRQTWSRKASENKLVSHLVRKDLKSAKSFYRYKNKQAIAEKQKRDRSGEGIYKYMMNPGAYSIKVIRY